MSHTGAWKWLLVSYHLVCFFFFFTILDERRRKWRGRMKYSRSRMSGSDRDGMGKTWMVLECSKHPENRSLCSQEAISYWIHLKAGVGSKMFSGPKWAHLLLKHSVSRPSTNPYSFKAPASLDPSHLWFLPLWMWKGKAKLRVERPASSFWVATWRLLVYLAIILKWPKCAPNRQCAKNRGRGRWGAKPFWFINTKHFSELFFACVHDKVFYPQNS